MARPRNATVTITGFGPVCAPELRAVGLDSAEKIRELGWEEAFLRWAGRFPARLNANAAYAMMAAERGVSWLKLSPTDRLEALGLARRMRSRRFRLRDTL